MSNSILVIDDDPNLLIGLKLLFEKSGFTVFSANCGSQGLEQIYHQNPDLVLCDVMMPSPNGFTLKKIVNTDPHIRNIPFVFLTARNAKTDMMDGLENHQADDYIVKPFDPDVLLARIRNIIRRNKFNLARTQEKEFEARSRIEALSKELETASQLNSNLEEAQEHQLISSLKGLSKAQELRDKETSNHCERVAKLAALFASQLALTDIKLDDIYLGAYFHDIGKIGIPDNILLKKGPLTDEEKKVIQQHPLYAYDLLSNFDFLRAAINIPLYHHERWDGSGYPHGLKGTDIPIDARLFSIVDVWDALTSDRAYRPAMSKDEAIAYLHTETGKSFQPELVEIFMELIAKGVV